MFHKITYLPAHAGHFLIVSFNHVLEDHDAYGSIVGFTPSTSMAKREMSLGTCLAPKCKIFLCATGAGHHFNAEKESGWVRMTFSFQRRTTIEALEGGKAFRVGEV
jgi:hypothetical protein